MTLYVDGNKVGEGRVPQTEPMLFSADETCDVGFQARFALEHRLSDRGTTSSVVEVNWSRSTSERTRRTLIISSRRNSGSASLWHISRTLNHFLPAAAPKLVRRSDSAERQLRGDHFDLLSFCNWPMLLKKS